MLNIEDAEINVVSACPQEGYSLVKEPTIIHGSVKSRDGHLIQPVRHQRLLGGAEALMTNMNRKKWRGTEAIPEEQSNMNKAWRNSGV